MGNKPSTYTVNIKAGLCKHYNYQLGPWVLAGAIFLVGASSISAQPQTSSGTKFDPSITAHSAATVPPDNNGKNTIERSLSAPEIAKEVKTVIDENYGDLPLYFEANLGQTDPRVKFVTTGHDFSLFLTEGEAVLALTASPNTPSDKNNNGGVQKSQTLKGSALFMNLAGANTQSRAQGRELLPGKSHYIAGSDPSEWYTDIPHYKKVAYPDIYPGIDLIYYGNQQQLEFDFVVASGIDPSSIKMQFTGADHMATDKQGNLLLHTAVGTVVQHKPIIFQKINGKRVSVEGSYALLEENIVGFNIGAYDKKRELVIDPILSYSTYLRGSNQEIGSSIAVDSTGNAYITGGTSSGNFPTTPGAFENTPDQSGFAVFITKLSADGSSLIYSTKIFNGLSGQDIAVDESGSAYITGQGLSTYPTTPGVVQTVFGGWDSDAFVTKLSPDGASLIYSTFIGGESSDIGAGIALGNAGEVYVTGKTNSLDFPITSGAYQTTPGGIYDSFVVKLTSDAASLVYSTFLGGNRDEGTFHMGDIAVDILGYAYVTGETQSTDFPVTTNAFQTTYGGNSSDGYVTKLATDGASLVYSTYLGDNGWDFGTGIAVDQAGQAHITGSTVAGSFPVTFPVSPTATSYNAFVTKFSSDGASLIYSTILGGSDFDGPLGFDGGIALDSNGRAYVTGRTFSADFPTTANAVQNTLNGQADGYVAVLAADGSELAFSTFLGGSNEDVINAIAVDKFGSAYITGATSSNDFPTTVGAFQDTIPYTIQPYYSTAFVARLNLGQSPLCDIQLSGQQYTLDDTITLSSLRYINPSSIDIPTEIKVWHQMPSSLPISIVNIGADESFILPAATDSNVGPIMQLTVTPLTPAGTHQIGCRMLNPVTGALLSEDIDTFSVVQPSL